MVEYLPAIQLLQVPSEVELAIEEYLPLPQLLHAASPNVILYLPATQAVQGLPSGPVQPALQVQSTSSSLASGALEFDGHP